jgi:hypothetical protein
MILYGFATMVHQTYEFHRTIYGRWTCILAFGFSLLVFSNPAFPISLASFLPPMLTLSFFNTPILLRLFFFFFFGVLCEATASHLGLTCWLSRRFLIEALFSRSDSVHLYQRLTHASLHDLILELSCAVLMPSACKILSVVTKG